jgi:hypothetical protein
MTDDVLSRGKRRNHLWVEGRDDEVVMYSLLNVHGITSSVRRERLTAVDEFFKVKEHDGISNLLKALNVELKGDVVDNRYGIVVDADADIAIIWSKLQSILDEAGYDDIPLSPVEEGTILERDGLPRLGIWIMPDNKIPGMMEDFISFLGPQDDELWPLAVNVVEKVMEKKCNFPSSYKSKAYLHTWLAWQETPGRPMGQAITLKYVNATTEHARLLITWFRKLFELEGKQ